MNSEALITHIMLRNFYQKQRYYFTIRFMIMIAGILLFALYGGYAILNKKPIYRYLVVDSNGRLLPQIPVTQPNKSDKEILEWTVDSTTKILTLDFANYRQQMTKAQFLMTPLGFQQLEKALSDSGNWRAILENKYVTTAVPNGPATITDRGIISDNAGNRRYFWNIEFPMIVNYRSSKQSTAQDVKTLVRVIRMDESVSENGLAIRQINMR